MTSATFVNTTYGQVKGEKNENVYVWKGIPYAKAPVGSLRFQPPEAPESWDGVLDATQFGPVAPQPDSEIMNNLGNDAESSSEDCLNLNIWSPSINKDKLRPVMVWIHGGAFMNGSGSSGLYDGTSFASSGDVVVVTINYRLGILGFLHLGELAGEEYATSGNCGILDQVAALRWVQDNIENFGGDPNRVTIFGESAGAMSVGVLLAMPSAKGLFHQAILQSGAASNVIRSSQATKVAERILTSLGIVHDELPKLRDIPVEKLIEVSSTLPMMKLVPVVDGISLPNDPEEALEDGFAKDIPILIGVNKDEYRLFTYFDPRWKNAEQREVEQIFESTFGTAMPAIQSQLSENDTLDQDLYDKLMTAQIFTKPALKLAEYQVRQGAPTYMYRFDWESPVAAGGLKSCHALEIPFVWNNLNEPQIIQLTGNSPEREEIAKQMHQAWIAFAHSGNPNHEGIPDWPEYNLTKQETMLFNKESRVESNPFDV
ncbi:carboxylesterase/lipase family protein [Oceanobacillus caeni]|uniref:carboxylesterase/lipase family protein n=1 Tax=Oceanobacillus caeni TaxID=405946 RepID=UPI00195A2EED